MATRFIVQTVESSKGSQRRNKSKTKGKVKGEEEQEQEGRNEGGIHQKNSAKFMTLESPVACIINTI